MFQTKSLAISILCLAATPAFAYTGEELESQAEITLAKAKPRRSRLGRAR